MRMMRIVASGLALLKCRLIGDGNTKANMMYGSLHHTSLSKQLCHSLKLFSRYLLPGWLCR